MIGFGVAALVLLAGAVLCILSGLRQPVASAGGEGPLSAYRERRADLEHERALGQLSEAGYQQLQVELQQRLLDDGAVQPAVADRLSLPLWAWAIFGLLPLAALWLYASTGDLAGWQAQQLFERSQQQAQAGVDNRATLQALSEALERALSDRERPRALYLLAQVDMERGELAAAARHYARLAELEPGDAAIQAQAAQSAYLAGGQQLNQSIRTWLQRALAMDPQQPTALGLAGIDAFEQQQFGVALDYWQRLLAQLPEGAAGADIIRQGIAHARHQLGQQAVAEPSGVAVPVAIGLASKVKPEGTLFVFARIPGERVPLAAVRVDQPSFPLQVSLSDANIMDPSRRLSEAKQIEVVARLSRSGQVGATAGDAEARSEPLVLAVAEQGVALTLAVDG